MSEGRAAPLLCQRVREVAVSPLICCKDNLMTYAMYCSSIVECLMESSELVIIFCRLQEMLRQFFVAL